MKPPDEKATEMVEAFKPLADAAERTRMTKDQFLARCANAYDAELIRPATLRLLDRWLDFVLRFEGGQMAYVADFLEQEKRRHQFHSGATLAGDTDGYDLIRISAILNHKCQTCATDPNAWWTRGAFCPHRADARREMGEI